MNVCKNRRLLKVGFLISRTYIFSVKILFSEQRSRIIKHGVYAKFDNNKFGAALVKELSFKSRHVNQFIEFTQNVLKKMLLLRKSILEIMKAHS